MKNLKDILETKSFDFEKIATSSGWYKEIDEYVPEEDEEEHHCCGHCHDNEEHHCCGHHHEEEHECHCGHHHEEGHECHCGHNHKDGHDHVEEYGINTFVYYRREPMDRKKFYEYISKPWPKKIIRAKGITYFKDEKDMSYMFEQAGSLKDLTPAGPWLACEAPDFVEQVLEQNPDIAKEVEQKIIAVCLHYDIDPTKFKPVPPAFKEIKNNVVSSFWKASTICLLFSFVQLPSKR